LLLTAFSYYLYHTAERKGWFDVKVPFSTGLSSAAGLKPGDPVRLMGFPVGELTAITPNSPSDQYGVTVDFQVKLQYTGYIWIDSRVHVASDFLGNRSLEILKGEDGAPTVLTGASPAQVLNRAVADKAFEQLKKKVEAEDSDYSEQAILIESTNRLNGLLTTNANLYYTNLGSIKPYWITPFEPPALADRLESVVNTVEIALPNILRLTNQIAAVLSNATGAAAELQTSVAQVQPLLSNLTFITSNLRDPQGSLGEWLLPTNLNAQLARTLATADATLKTARATLEDTDTNVTTLVAEIGKSLNNLASLTSNLNSQVESNTNLVGEISTAIVHTDDLVQGLKRHWFLRSAFKTNKPPASVKGK
jgi:ABC-type transporter Mla subunit MlaD